jgi:hypothetical protein
MRCGRTGWEKIKTSSMGRKPTTWTAVNRDYENLRIGVHALFRDVGIETQPAAA